MGELGELLLELILQLVFEVFADAIWRSLPETVRQLLKVALAVAGAAGLAWISSLFAPAPFITSPPMRIAYLVIGPVVTGWAMSRLGYYFESHDRFRSSLERFGLGWLFAFVFALGRYLLTS